MAAGHPGQGDGLDGAPGALRLRQLGFLLLGGLVVILLAARGASAAQPPYEPNDSAAAAFGPLAVNQTYTAGIETQNDQDWFYFYVSALSTAQVQVTLKALSGPYSEDEVEGVLFDSAQRSLGEGFAVEVGHSRTDAITLGPGKYFFRVEGVEGDEGVSYSIVTGGTEGAFGEYAPIAAQCATATTGVNTAQEALTKATLRLRKAERKVVRTEHRPYSVRKRAAKAEKKDRAAVTSANDALKAAELGQKPWCEIPQ